MANSNLRSDVRSRSIEDDRDRTCDLTAVDRSVVSQEMDGLDKWMCELAQSITDLERRLESALTELSPHIKAEDTSDLLPEQRFSPLAAQINNLCLRAKNMTHAVEAISERCQL